MIEYIYVLTKIPLLYIYVIDRIEYEKVNPRLFNRMVIVADPKVSYNFGTCSDFQDNWTIFNFFVLGHPFPGILLTLSQWTPRV